jgi:hypothetical protein
VVIGLARGRTKRDNFRVSAGVGIRNSPIVPSRDNLSIDHYHCADGHLAFGRRYSRFRQGCPHAINVFLRPVGGHYSHSIVAGGFPEIS